MKEVMSHPYRFMLIPAREININRLYQRKLNDKTVKKILSKFDYHNVNCVKVVWKDDGWYAFDGQHTVTALAMLFGYNYQVPCLIYEDVPDWCAEAELFEGANDRETHKAVSLAESWKSRLFRGEPVATDIKNRCERYGLKVPNGNRCTGDGWVRSLGAVESIYKEMDKNQFDQMLYVLTSAWHGKRESLTAPILTGLSIFIKTYAGEYNRAALINRLGREDPNNIIRAGKASVAAGKTKYAREILNVYNKGTTTGRLADKLG